MQDERAEDHKNIDAEGKQTGFEKWELALSILKEAVAAAEIKDISEYKGEPLNLRWHVFSQATPKDVILKMLVQGTFGTINADVSLIVTAKLVVDEVDAKLSQPDANRLLDFAEEEYSEILRENARMILTALVNQIPVVAFALLSRAFQESIQSHIKTYVEPRLKEHWQSLGLPEDFTISPSEELNEDFRRIEVQFESLKQQFLGNKRARLTEERLANLANEYEQLRSAYGVAKDFYNQSRRAFFSGRRNRTEDEWKEEWMSLGSRMFTELHYRCLEEMSNSSRRDWLTRTPSEEFPKSRRTGREIVISVTTRRTGFCRRSRAASSHTSTAL